MSATQTALMKLDTTWGIAAPLIDTPSWIILTLHNQQFVPMTRWTPATHQDSLDSTFQTHDLYQLERQWQQKAWEHYHLHLALQAHMTLPWKCITVPSPLPHQGPDTLMLNSGLRKQLTTTFSRGTSNGNYMLDHPVKPTSWMNK